MKKILEKWQKKELSKQTTTFPFKKFRTTFDKVKVGHQVKHPGVYTLYTKIDPLKGAENVQYTYYKSEYTAYLDPLTVVMVVGINEKVYKEWKEKEKNKLKDELAKHLLPIGKRKICLD